MQPQDDATFRAGPFEPPVPPTGSGALDGVRLAVKAVIDVAGHVTDAGNPTWAASRPAATEDAPVVGRLRAAGAGLVGTTLTDELAFSLSGTNVHHGTPRNPRAPDREPGGSSAGSAVAVASGRADLALGTDTGGSVRVPANHTGLYGLRPTHGATPMSGVVPLARSFDTVGLFARDAGLLATAADVLLDPGDPVDAPVTDVVVATDLLSRAHPEHAAAVQALAERLAAASGCSLRTVELAGDDLEEWFRGFRTRQAFEAWQAHGDWVVEHDPHFGPGIAERFRLASEVTWQDVVDTHAPRARAAARINELLVPGTVLVQPSAAGPPPRLDAPREQKGAWRGETLRLTCTGGLSGAPVVAVPVGEVDGAPVGASVLGARGADRWLTRCLADVANG